MPVTKGSQVRIAAAWKRRLALQLRLAGRSYQVIADTPVIVKEMRLARAGEPGARKLFSGSKGRAWEAVQYELAELRKEANADAHEIRDLELERLDRLQAGLWTAAVGQPGVTPADPQAVAEVRRLMERRSRYLGLDAADELDERQVRLNEAMAAKWDDDLRAAMTDVELPDDWQTALMEAFAARLARPTDVRAS